MLAKADMGHTALPVVRPACDELIWVKYLCSLDEDKCGARLHILNAVESAGLINAQQQYVGTRTMHRSVSRKPSH